MTSFVLKTPARQHFELQAERAHISPSLRRAIWERLILWVRKESLPVICRTLFAVWTVLAITFLWLAPATAWGILSSVVEWNGYRVPMLLGTLLVVFRGWPTARWAYKLARRAARPKTGNQHTFEGLPVDELATFLIEGGSFKRDEAMTRFGISQEKHTKMAEELEKRQVLVRGANNSRVLNTVTREQLVRQLGKKPALYFRDGEWFEAGSSYELHLKDEARREAKAKEGIARLERKEERLKRSIQELAENPFLTRELAM